MVSCSGDNVSLLDLFHAELETHLLALEKGLENVETSPGREHVESLARAAHSLRGASRIVGLDIAARLGQAMEELLSCSQEWRATARQAWSGTLARGHLDLPEAGGLPTLRNPCKSSRRRR